MKKELFDFIQKTDGSTETIIRLKGKSPAPPIIEINYLMSPSELSRAILSLKNITLELQIRQSEMQKVCNHVWARDYKDDKVLYCFICGANK